MKEYIVLKLTKQKEPKSYCLWSEQRILLYAKMRSLRCLYLCELRNKSCVEYHNVNKRHFWIITFLECLVAGNCQLPEIWRLNEWSRKWASTGLMKNKASHLHLILVYFFLTSSPPIIPHPGALRERHILTCGQFSS